MNLGQRNSTAAHNMISLEKARKLFSLRLSVCERSKESDLAHAKSKSRGFSVKMEKHFRNKAGFGN